MPVRAPPPVVSQPDNCLISILVARRMLSTSLKLSETNCGDDRDQHRYDGSRDEKHLHRAERQLLVYPAKLQKLQFSIQSHDLYAEFEFSVVYVCWCCSHGSGQARRAP